MAVDLIKKIAEQNSWSFSYGSGEWHNLTDQRSEYRKDFEDRKVHVLLYTVTKNEVYNDFGGLDSETYTCALLMGVTSNFNDKDYNYKWENNIKPMIENRVQTMKDGLNSCGYRISGGLSQKEFSNLFDNNLDGINLEFTLSKV
tara:strand:+ start:1782 stop:2213 length:432 start_codon:yes stop_codon:yes gene_type:complete